MKKTSEKQLLHLQKARDAKRIKSESEKTDIVNNLHLINDKLNKLDYILQEKLKETKKEEIDEEPPIKRIKETPLWDTNTIFRVVSVASSVCGILGIGIQIKKLVKDQSENLYKEL